MVFTYHSRHGDAWRAIGEALDQAQCQITAIWPVLAYLVLGHDSGTGSCEWDVVVVLRPKDQLTGHPATPPSKDDWIRQMGEHGLMVNEADSHSFDLALGMARGRFAKS